LSSKKNINVLLAGNPNSGKSTLFNALTGLNQKTGNYAGVTVDKLTGKCKLEKEGTVYTIKITDLPGIYSVFAKTLDEQVAVKSLLSEIEKPDVVVVVADATNLKRNLLLVSQIIDLGYKTVLVLNMMDEAKEQNIDINTHELSKLLGVTIIESDSRKGNAVVQLKQAIVDAETPGAKFYLSHKWDTAKYTSYIEFVKIQLDENYKFSPDYLLAEEQDKIQRFTQCGYIFAKTVTQPEQLKKRLFTQKIDALLTHSFWGYFILAFLLFTIFQFVFYLAEYPMSWIENLFLSLGALIKEQFSPGMLRDLVAEGVLSGLSGVMMFIPQIALLFFFIAVLEDSGYMARAGFITDKLMRKVGLNGRSVIPLLSATACAVPSIMSTRTISNYKDRLITIFIMPLISCSARLPVYTLLIAVMFPVRQVGGLVNLKGLVLFSLYMLGFVFSFATAYVMKKILKTKEASHYIMEMPVYRNPPWRSVGLTVYNKVKVFVTDAGKIILSIAVVLWFLSSYGPGEKTRELKNKKESFLAQTPIHSDSLAFVETELLEHSYIGYLGRGMEPVIKPLGFDWKIGIAILTSFAAREVFVGTMSTIYGAAGGEDTEGIRNKLSKEKDKNGNPAYTLAVCLSLLVFYVFALQCMSTIAVVKRETKSWKWPAIQFVYMGALAWLGAWLTYLFFS